MVEKNSQVRHSVEIVKSLFFDQTSYSTECRTDLISWCMIKKKTTGELQDNLPAEFRGYWPKETTVK